MEQDTTTRKIRKSIILTFDNHPPIRLWGNFDSEVDGKYISEYEDGCVWSSGWGWGHHEINYYVCRSGKRIYWASYNSGMQYNGRDPRTTRMFLRDVAAIKAHLVDRDAESEWHRICHRVDPSLIVDSDLL